MLQLWSKKMLSTIWCTFKIIPTPADAIVTINGEVRNSVTLIDGSEVSWSIEADGRAPQEGTLTLLEDKVLDIVLEEASLDPALKGVPVQFNYTGAVQTYIVPLGCRKVSVDCFGAGGGGASSANGKGGRVQCTLSVKGNKPLYIYVGGQGSSSGGWNGGGNCLSKTASTYKNSGAGASDIRTVQASSGSWYDTSHASWDEDVSLLSRLVVAGGGGGMSQNGYGGNGGGLEGGVTDGGKGTKCTPATQTSAGKGAYHNQQSGDGAFGIGGSCPSYDSNQSGSGGGGGWYGGGGGIYFQPGGGGSSYTHPELCTDVVHTQGGRAGHGYVIITPIE